MHVSLISENILESTKTSEDVFKVVLSELSVNKLKDTLAGDWAWI